MTVNEQELRSVARDRVKKRRDLGAHVVAYIVINAAVVGIWAITGAGYFWPAWLMLAWGIGLVLNAWDVFFRRPITEADVDREMEQMKR
jgi:hypothetical protein